jgi:DNA-binding transcriptional ArsR family regulator
MKDILQGLNNDAFDSRVRLGIMSILMVNDWVDFPTFKEMLASLAKSAEKGMTDGNLSTHMSILEGKGYIEIRKQFVGKKPQTSYATTILGRKAFSDYLAALENLMKNIG